MNAILLTGIMVSSLVSPKLDAQQYSVSWNPSKISRDYFNWNVRIENLGDYSEAEVTFRYSHGANALRIANVEVFVNGQSVSRDYHDGTTGVGDNNNVYYLDLRKLPSGSTGKLTITCRGEGGTDSYGTAYITLHR